MRRLSYPPFVVFFDTIAVFLFILILNQNEEPIKIKILTNKVENGIGYIVYKDGDTFKRLSDNTDVNEQNDKIDFGSICIPRS